MDFKKTIKQVTAVILLGNPAFKRILLYGGSRSGKTFILIRQVILRALKEPNSKHLIVRLIFNDIHRSIWLGTLPKVLKICFKGVPVKWNKSSYFIQFPNGSEIWLGGLDDKDRTEKILGNEYSTIYFNEAHQMKWLSVMIALTRLAEKNNLIKKAFFDCNPPTTKSWMYLLFILKIDPITRESLKMQEMYAILQMNPRDNVDNISEDYITTTLETLSERHRKRFLDGEFTNDVEGALWNSEMINQHRVLECPKLRRKVIAVDPATTSNKESDDTGIVLAGKGYDNHYYVFGDLTGKYTPNEWGLLVVETYADNRIDSVVAEVNQGGDMVESNIRNINSNIRVKKVHAINGKVARAEPIVGLYERGEVHHVGMLGDLETEMTEWDVKTSKVSPNRIDALVHALQDLSDAPVYKPAKWNF